MTDGDKILRTQAWEYYAIVAAQRLTVINFYIAISTVLSGGQIAFLQTPQYSKATVGLGILLVTLSFIFWKWDKRSSDLIKLAEATLRHFEEQLASEQKNSVNSIAYLFTNEYSFTRRKKSSKWLFIHIYFTYRICLNLLFLTFSLTGICVALMSLLLSHS